MQPTPRQFARRRRFRQCGSLRKTVEQQAVLMLHKSRDLMVRQRTMLINALRGHLPEYGVVTRFGTGA